MMEHQHHQIPYNSRPALESATTYTTPINQEHKVPIEKLAQYRVLLQMCKRSKLLEVYPTFYEHIHRAEAIYVSYDTSGEID